MKQNKNGEASKKQKDVTIVHKDLRALTKEIRLWREELQRSDVWYRHLAKGMVRGLGTLIGATIIAGILFLLLNQFIEKTGLENLISKDFLEQWLRSK